MHKKYPPQGTLLGSTRHSAEELVNIPLSTLLGNNTAAGKMQPLLGKNLLCTQSARETARDKHHQHSVGIQQSLTCFGYKSRLCFGEPSQIPADFTGEMLTDKSAGETATSRLGDWGSIDLTPAGDNHPDPAREANATPLGTTHAIHR